MLTRKELDTVNGLEDQKINIDMLISSMESSQYVETKLGLIDRYNCDDKHTLQSVSINDEAKWFESNCGPLSKRIKVIVLKELKNDSKKLQDRISRYISEI